MIVVGTCSACEGPVTQQMVAGDARCACGATIITAMFLRLGAAR